MTVDENKEALAKIFDHSPHVDDLGDSDPFKAKALEIERAFTAGIDLLRKYPNPSIVGLANLMWDIVANKLVLVATGGGVNLITFMGYNRKEGFQQALVLIPLTWVDDLAKDEILQAGAIIGAGSKCIDYYNGLMAKDREDDFTERAYAYESEFLLTFKDIHPEYEFNKHQKAVLTIYPQGIKSERVVKLMYYSKPFFVAEA